MFFTPTFHLLQFRVLRHSPFMTFLRTDQEWYCDTFSTSATFSDGLRCHIDEQSSRLKALIGLSRQTARSNWQSETIKKREIPIRTCGDQDEVASNFPAIFSILRSLLHTRKIFQFHHHFLPPPPSKLLSIDLCACGFASRKNSFGVDAFSGDSANQDALKA